MRRDPEFGGWEPKEEVLMPSCTAAREDADHAPFRAATTSGEKDAQSALRRRRAAKVRDEHVPRHRSGTTNGCPKSCQVKLVQRTCAKLPTTVVLSHLCTPAETWASHIRSSLIGVRPAGGANV